ncbi:MAG: hypothetical protein B9S32_01085 [Verrucomicrobia bacterium Tous-C9LFEB]|nr:MAG: hypothetical protein B9S32_01085 [Verrucomicrobia bacterium Tous-C9LFEB]
MSTIILSCDVLREELAHAKRLCGLDYEIRWVDSAAHSCTDNLRESIQRELDLISDSEIDTVILSFGFCGNAVAGLKTGAFRLIIPKSADCIAMLLHPHAKQTGKYYITPGWLRKGSVWSDYKRCCSKYGEVKADKIFKVMLAGYEHISTIRTESVELTPDYYVTADEMSRDLKLQHEVVPGRIDFFVKLLAGPWDDEFIIVPEHSTMELGDLIV